MLVLTRMPDEEIYIYQEGDDNPLAKIVICEIAHGKVRLGFMGDDDIVFHRREVAEAIERNGDSPSSSRKRTN